MSAPEQGRQSPEPERQADKQVHAPPASDVNDQDQGPGEKAADVSKEQLGGLSSNPKGPLEDAAAAKTEKTVGKGSAS